MMSINVFYSWQSDHPNATNRGFIETALGKAIRKLNEGRDAEVDLVVLDRDTANVSGTPEIASTIFDKIEQANAFVADVTTILRKARDDGSGDRTSPNPNVLLELGYAAKALGWDRIICVANLAYGNREELPFDLRGRRILAYEMPQNCSERAPTRDVLARDLEAALRPMVDTPVEERTLATQRDLLEVEKLRGEVDAQRRTRRSLLDAKISAVVDEETSQRRPNWFGVLVIPEEDINSIEFHDVDRRTLSAPDLIDDHSILFDHLVIHEDAYQSFLPYDGEPNEAHYLIKLRRDGVIHMGTDRVVNRDKNDVWWPIVATQQCVDACRISRHVWQQAGIAGAATAVVVFNLAVEVGLVWDDDPRFNGIKKTFRPERRLVRHDFGDEGPDDGVSLTKRVLDRLYQEIRYKKCPFFTEEGQFTQEYEARLQRARLSVHTVNAGDLSTINEGNELLPGRSSGPFSS
jgi:hypothetical protein